MSRAQARGPIGRVLFASFPAAGESRYTVLKVTDDMVWIVDVGRECRSVTNDAERVCEALAIQYGNRRIIYRDSDGNWDELMHENGRFIGFTDARELAP